MAKVSVFVPDVLLDRARALHGQVSTSQLVQRGLEQLTAHLTEPGDPDYAQRPADAQDMLAAARDKLLVAGRVEFERGYRAGAEDAGDLDWPFLEELADAHFDLLTRLSHWKRSLAPYPPQEMEFSPPGWFSILSKRFGALINPIGFPDLGFAPTRTFVRGYGAALRDVWATVNGEFSAADYGEPESVRPSTAAGAEADDIETILARHERHDPNTRSRDVYQAMVADGWEARPSKTRDGKGLSDPGYIHLTYRGSKRKIVVYLNSKTLGSFGKAEQEFAASLPHADLKRSGVYFAHSDGDFEQALSNAAALRALADGQTQYLHQPATE